MKTFLTGLGIVLLGLCAAAGQPPLQFAVVSLLAVAGGFVMILKAQSFRACFWRSWGFGVGYFAATLHWIVEPFLVDSAVYGWMAPFALILMAGGMALFPGGAAVLARRLCPSGSDAQRALALVVTMSGAELLRAVIFTGFPWGMIGTIWIDTPLAQGAALFGAHGLNAMTYLAAAGLALLGLRRGKQPLVPVLLALLPLMLVFGYGKGALSRGPDAGDTERPVLRLVQPNAAQHLKWRADMIPVFWQRKLALTAAPGAGGQRPDLVIWPEVTLPYMMGSNPDADREVAAAAGGVPVIVGAQRRDGERLLNALAVVQPDASIGPIYDKHHLVPFGEYFPGGALAARFGLYGLATLGPGGFSAGPGPRVLDLTEQGLGRVLPLICYEAIFPRHVRVPGERADWIVQITNDGWFGSFAGPQQHFALARLRAIETGLPLVRVANTGITAVIDSRGLVVDTLPRETEGFLDVALPPARTETPYSRFANWPLLAVLLLGALYLAAVGRAVRAE